MGRRLGAPLTLELQIPTNVEDPLKVELTSQPASQCDVFVDYTSGVLVSTAAPRVCHRSPTFDRRRPLPCF